MIGLAVIFDSKLPVAVEGKGNRGICPAVKDRLFEHTPAIKQGIGGRFKIRRVAAKIYENNVTPYMGPDADQRVIAMLNAVQRVYAGPADMGRAAQVPSRSYDQL